MRSGLRTIKILFLSKNLYSEWIDGVNDMGQDVFSKFQSAMQDMERILREKKAAERRAVSLEDQLAELDRAISNLDDIRDSFGYEADSLANLLGKGIERAMRSNSGAGFLDMMNARNTFYGNLYNSLIDNSGEQILEDVDHVYRYELDDPLDELKAIRAQKQREYFEQKGMINTFSARLAGM